VEKPFKKVRLGGELRGEGGAGAEAPWPVKSEEVRGVSRGRREVSRAGKGVET